MTPAPAPIAPRPRRRFPVRQSALGERLSLPGLLHAAEVHPELPPSLRPRVRAVRAELARLSLVVDVQQVPSGLLGGA